MAITEVTRVTLDGEQPELFAGLEAEERKAISEAQAPFIARRGQMLAALLAGKGLLAAVQQTQGIDIRVEAHEIVLTPPGVERALSLEPTG